MIQCSFNYSAVLHEKALMSHSTVIRDTLHPGCLHFGNRHHILILQQFLFILPTIQKLSQKKKLNTYCKVFCIYCVLPYKVSLCIYCIVCFNVQCRLMSETHSQNTLASSSFCTWHMVVVGVFYPTSHIWLYQDKTCWFIGSQIITTIIRSRVKK